MMTRTRTSWRAAATKLRRVTHIGATAIAVSLASLTPAHSQGKQAQVLAVPPIIVTPTVPDSSGATAIPEEQCRYIFDRADKKLEKEGKEFISATTRKGLMKFFAFGPDKQPHCNGPLSTRFIPWETQHDRLFILALADVSYGAFKVSFMEKYGYRPADQPTIPKSPPAARQPQAQQAPGS